jgi:dephospho-CoA kinase
MMLKVGLTGGIGTGKSVIANIFRLLNVPVFNSDIEAARLMHSSDAIKRKLIELFGDDVYDDFGLNRTYLREKIFTDDQARIKVNEMIHPEVRKVFKKFCEQHKKQLYVLQEAAILFESGGADLLDYVMVVTAPESIRIKRVMERDGISEETLRTIMSKQMPENEKMAKADFIIYNNEKQLLMNQVYMIHEKLQKLY